MVEENGENRLNPENDNGIDDIKEESTTENEKEHNWEDLLGSGSIMKKIIKEGQPDTRPQRLQICQLCFKCSLEDGLVVEKQDNVSVQLGDSEVIQGLDLAIALMNVGEICELKIEPRLAYGSKGLSPLIPKDTKLHYTVELVSVQDEDDPETLPISQRKLKGNKKRERGNWWYGRGENTVAIQCYRRALDYLDELEGGITDPQPDGVPEVTDGDLQDLLEDRINVCNNMAAAQIKLGTYDTALNSLEKVLHCQPQNVKALFRKAKIYRVKNEYTMALKYLQKASLVSPDDADIQKEITSLSSLIKKQKVSERELAQRMFSMGNNASKKRKKGDSKFHVWAIFGASVAVGLMGLAAYKFKYV